MRYVLDSSVGIKSLLREVDSDKAIRIRDDFIAGALRNNLAGRVSGGGRSLDHPGRAARRITPSEGASHLKTMLATLPVLHP